VPCPPDVVALCSEDDAAIVLGGIEAVAQASTQWERRPSFARHQLIAVPWPLVEFAVHRADHVQQQLQHDILAAEGCPPFPEPQSAWRAFFEGNFSLMGAQGVPSGLATIRLTDTTGWLGDIQVTPTLLTAQVHGDGLDGACLELFSVTDRAEKSIVESGRVSFPLASGLPADGWVWLKRGKHWLDYRAIDSRSGYAADLARSGVTIDIPTDPQANVEALIVGGEGPQVEFKRELPESAEQKRRQLKTVAAFANGDGGVMVFGVDPDEVTVTGLSGDDPKELRDRLYGLIHRTVVPSPTVTIEPYEVHGETILLLHVEPGPAPPYGIAADKGARDKPEYFVRRGSSTVHAQPGELREAARSRPTSQASGFNPLRSW
jgi:hypothetical protein